MKILLVHNYYQEPGGEDVVFERERNLLENNGHHVITYVRRNREIGDFSIAQRLGLVKTIVAAPDSRMDVKALLRDERPDVVHIHNTFMLVSPSIYQACLDARVPTVQTLHNYRLLCPAVTLYRAGHICEECVSNTLWRGVQHGCYRQSRAITAAVAAMLQTHRLLGTWSNKITAYIALTDFAKRKFIQGGLPAAKLHVKPNFVDPDPGERQSNDGYALFVGRLSPEKGVSTVLEAWKRLPAPLPLKIAGDGPQRAELEAQCNNSTLKCIQFLGHLGRDETVELMKGAAFLLVPSLWYEGFALVIIEAFACGIPVVASRLGAMAENVADRKTGLHFAAGDASDLARVVAWASQHTAELADMGRNARKTYEALYTPERNYQLLLDIYNHAITQPLL